MKAAVDRAKSSRGVYLFLAVCAQIGWGLFPVNINFYTCINKLIHDRPISKRENLHFFWVPPFDNFEKKKIDIVYMYW